MLNLEVLHSTISQQEIVDKLLPLYDISGIIKCVLWQSSINDTYIVNTISNQYIIKIYRSSWKNYSDINYEIDAIQYLHFSGVNVSYPLKRFDGLYITEISAPEGLRYAILTTYAEGKELTYQDNSDAYLYGQNIAKIHLSTDKFKTEHAKQVLDIDHLLNEPLQKLKIFFINDPCRSDYITNLSEQLFDKLNGIEFGINEFKFCHGDLHGGNAHLSADKLTFFDFDFCGIGWRSYDIAVFRWGCMLRKKEEQWGMFINGYQSVKMISDKDLNYTLPFVAIRDIWVMALHLNRISDLGQSFINDYYLDKRFKFLQNIESQL